MRNKQKNTLCLPVIAAVLLSPALLHSCASCKKTKAQETLQEPASDTTEVFVPLHPPVVVGKTWREAMNESE